MARLDPHSYADDGQPQTEALSLKLRVNFQTRQLEGEVTLRFRSPGHGALDLDTRDLTLLSVEEFSGVPLRYQLHPPEPILGARLSVQLPKGTAGIRIRYRTAPTASALQWLEPRQTLGGKQPFLFSQCQAIHARSVVPVQDTPRIRVQFDASLTVPRALRAVFAAAFVGREEHGEEAVERFRMPQPVPPYLLAFAVGDLASRDLGPRSRVWAEPGLLDQAAHEFAEVDKMLAAAETLFGKYDWERFDLLTMPPSFPYGGMENPRLTFLTPTLIAGDRSLVHVVAHELAHSWTGNLVTNANAEHFWLNEGFTVFAERRILEALEGPEACELHAALGRRSLEESLERFATTPGLTRLRTHLSGIDPDEAFSSVPYEKGYLFLRALEDAAGRGPFDRFLRTYLETFRFQSITTDDFLALTGRLLPGCLERIDAPAWIDQPGLPQSAPRVRSARLEKIEGMVRDQALPTAEAKSGWSAVEWQLFLELWPHPTPLETCAALDGRFKLTGSENYDVLVAWLVLAVSSGHPPALARIDRVLSEVGRMKYLRPLYGALAGHDLARAHEAFERCRPGYHPIAVQVIEAMLARLAG